MAKRRTGAARRKASGGGRSRSGARKASASKKRAAARGAARKARKTAKSSGRTSSAGKSARTAVARKGRKQAAARSAGTATARGAASRRNAPAKTVVARKAPGLDRPRRTVGDDDIVPTPPSSLDLDRHASAARTGRREMKEREGHLTQTGPAMTGGDVDADWESAYSVGDEAPGGDNPTPDQDIVDDIGRAVGVEYEDNEELKGEEKIAKRDRKRWELDPASSEDYNDRD